MRPTGALHLGHYHGALKNWVRLQQDYDCFYFVADWHALTTHYEDREIIERNVYDMVVDWLAAGVDPEKSTIFIQSRLPEHAELFTLLAMGTPLGWLERVPTYKDQMEKLKDRDLATFGFLGYPLLQAADILIYKAHYVPVGVDQVPHVELTREVARRFNFLYRAVLVEPEALLTEFPKIPGTDGRKMSKSYDNAIFLSDSPETVTAKVKPMMTDPARKRRSDPGNPEVCPVYDLHRVFTPAAE
ncbi:MAG TPA: tryptophan--tRNA ligase, partial [Albitalea sp.]|nr:tryptophan--tRNA ligase [Albitalea sp.]